MSADKTWGVMETEVPMRVRHVIPNDDLQDHWLASTCPCLPLAQQETHEVFIFIHHAFDGREKYERSGGS